MGNVYSDGKIIVVNCTIFQWWIKAKICTKLWTISCVGVYAGTDRELCPYYKNMIIINIFWTQYLWRAELL